MQKKEKKTVQLLQSRLLILPRAAKKGTAEKNPHPKEKNLVKVKLGKRDSSFSETIQPFFSIKIDSCEVSCREARLGKSANPENFQGYRKSVTEEDIYRQREKREGDIYRERENGVGHVE